jgi:hypothetical protein
MTSTSIIKNFYAETTYNTSISYIILFIFAIIYVSLYVITFNALRSITKFKIRLSYHYNITRIN